jgi:hypothetical protein
VLLSAYVLFVQVVPLMLWGDWFGGVDVVVWDVTCLLLLVVVSDRQAAAVTLVCLVG